MVDTTVVQRAEKTAETTVEKKVDTTVVQMAEKTAETTVEKLVGWRAGLTVEL